MTILRVKSDTIARISLPADDDAAFVAGDVVKYTADGVEKAGAAQVVGLVMETKTDNTAANPDNYGANLVTVIRGVGLISTDNYEGTLAVGNKVCVNTSTSKLRIQQTSETVVAICLGAGAAVELDFLLTGQM